MVNQNTKLELVNVCDICIVLLFQDGAKAYESMVNQSCDTVIEAVNRKREELLKVIAHDKEMRVNVLKEQVKSPNWS